jgi:hypothetical protein
MVIAATLLNAAEPVGMQKRRDELANLKWGMFICWSLSTFSGREWTPGVAIEWKDGDAWKELARGTTIAGEKEIAFPPVTARHVRLNILKAAGVPTIEEFDLYPPSSVVSK